MSFHDDSTWPVRLAKGVLPIVLVTFGLARCSGAPTTPTAASAVASSSPSSALPVSGALIGRFDVRIPSGGVASPTAVPGAPSGLAATIVGSHVTLTWNAASGNPATYVIEAGSAPGLADLANVATGNLATSFTALGVPNGTYYVRVRAASLDGLSAASNEVIVVVGSCATPAAPAGFSGSVNGVIVSLSWGASAGASSYQLEVGSASGLADLFNGDVGATTTLVTPAPPGTYFVRVRAKNACGISASSNEITIVVGRACTPVPIVPVTVSFNGLTVNGSQVTNYTESAFTVLAPSGNWRVVTTYGNPPPFIQFVRQASQPTVTEVIGLSTGGQPFHFGSFDLYSSIVPVPYNFTGLRDLQQVFSVSNTLPNPMGGFVTISNPYAVQPIDSLIISLSNTASACCSNPVGVDNLVVARRCAEGPATGTGGIFDANRNR